MAGRDRMTIEEVVRQVLRGGRGACSPTRGHGGDPPEL
jgi:hypothetical protein